MPAPIAAKSLASSAIKKDAQTQATGTISGTADIAVTLATSRILQMAWYAVLPSFGFSLLYIAFHMTMSFLSPQKFGKLGSEWGVGENDILYYIELTAFLGLFIIWSFFLLIIIGFIILIAYCADSRLECAIDALKIYFTQ